MGKRYLMDSNSVIDFLGGRLPDKGKQLILKIRPEISIITVIEIQSKRGIPDSEMWQYSAFVKSALVYSEINEAIAR